MKTEIETSISDFEFGKLCSFGDCEHEAEWAAWISHNRVCQEHSGLLCGQHEELVRKDAETAIGQKCWCGYRSGATLSSRYRAIRL